MALTPEQLSDIKKRLLETEPVDMQTAKERLLAQRPAREPVPVKEEPVGFFKGIFGDIKRRTGIQKEIVGRQERGERTSAETLFGLGGQAAGLASDVFGRGVGAVAKSVGKFFGRITPDIIEKPIVETAKLLGTEALKSPVGQKGVQALQGGLETYQAWKAENPRIAEIVEASLNIFEVALDVIPIFGAVKPVKRIAKETIDQAKDYSITIAKSKAKNVATKVDDAVGRITQGTSKEITQAKEALQLLDTTGIKTYEGLKQATDDAIKVFAKKQDELLDATGVVHKLDDVVTSTKVGEQVVRINYVDRAMKQLDEFYAKTLDSVNLAKIRQLRLKAKSQGLTTKEINALAREYGRTMPNAFTKTGEPLTSVTKIGSESTRKGVKETARNLATGKTGEVSKVLDEAMTSLFTLQTTAKKMEKAVQKLLNQVVKRGIIERGSRFLGVGLNKITGGALKGFVTSFIPSNVGNKILNALDLEKILSKNLKIINKLLDTGTDKDVLKFLDDFINDILKGGKPPVPPTPRVKPPTPKAIDVVPPKTGGVSSLFGTRIKRG